LLTFALACATLKGAAPAQLSLSGARLSSLRAPALYSKEEVQPSEEQ